MQRNQITDYLETHLKNGHSEQDLRGHLLNHGWSAAAVDDAFVQYHLEHAPKIKQAKKHRLRTMRNYKSRSLSFWQKSAVVFGLLAVLGGGAYVFTHNSTNEVAPIPPTPQLSYEQKQAYDANTIAGAVVQYVNANNGTVPSLLSVTPDQNIVLCNRVCDAVNSSVSRLVVYKPTDVSLMTYAPGLAVPDKSELYLVPGAKCASRKAIGEANPNPRSIVVLYGVAVAAGIDQHCITL